MPMRPRVSKNDEVCFKNEEFCIKNDEFCREDLGRCDIRLIYTVLVTYFGSILYKMCSGAAQPSDFERGENQE